LAATAAQPTFNPKSLAPPMQLQLVDDCTGSTAGVEKNRQRLVMADRGITRTTASEQWNLTGVLTVAITNLTLKLLFRLVGRRPTPAIRVF